MCVISLSRKNSKRHFLFCCVIPSAFFVALYSLFVLLIAAFAYLGSYIPNSAFEECGIRYLFTYSTPFLTVQYAEFLVAVFVLFCSFSLLPLGLGGFLSMCQKKPEEAEEEADVTRILFTDPLFLAPVQPTDIMMDPSPTTNLPVAHVDSTDLGDNSSNSDDARAPLLSTRLSLSTAEPTTSPLCTRSCSTRTPSPPPRRCTRARHSPPRSRSR